MKRACRHPFILARNGSCLAGCMLVLLICVGPVRSAIRNQQRVHLRPVQASTIVVDSMDVIHTFGAEMIFTLAAHSPNGITEAALLMRAGDDSRTEVLPVDFIPGQSVDARATRDLQSQPIAPFASIIYSWRLADSQGNTFTTPEQTYSYEDNRFQWQMAPRGAIVAHWHSGDLAFGQAVADIGYEALNRVSGLMGAAPPDRLDIYVYEKLSDLQSGLRLGGRTWVGGHADPSLGVVLVYAASDPFELIRLENDLSHELAHVMIYQVVGPHYSRMPVWLDEGLATDAELQPNPAYSQALAAAVQSETIIPLESLCGTFGVETTRAILSYAESASFVRYIQDRWGPVTTRQLLQAFSEGASCEGGVQRVLNLSLAELQADWESDVLRASPLRTFVREFFPYLLIFGPLALIIAALLFVPTGRSPLGKRK